MQQSTSEQRFSNIAAYLLDNFEVFEGEPRADISDSAEALLAGLAPEILIAGWAQPHCNAHESLADAHCQQYCHR